MDFFNSIRYEIWDTDDITNYIRINKEKLNYCVNSDVGRKTFEGFDYFNYSLLKTYDRDTNYTLNYHNLTLFEKQDKKSDDMSDYHKYIVALKEGVVIGILVCDFEFFNNSYWLYTIEYIDIKFEFRKKGIGKKLVKKLDSANFLKNKILFRSRSSSKELGMNLGKYYTAKNYALIEYKNLFYQIDKTFKPIIKPGKYDCYGFEIK